MKSIEMKSSEKVKTSQRQNTSIGNDYTLDPTGSRSNNLIHREPYTLEDDYLNPREFVPYKTKPTYHDDTDVDFSLLKENWKDFSSKLRLHRPPEEKPPLPQPMPRVYRHPSLDVPDNRPAAPDTRPDCGPGPAVPERKASIPIPQIYHLPPEDAGLTGWGPGPLPSYPQGYPAKMFTHPGQQDPEENVYQEIDPRNMEKQQQQQQKQQQQQQQQQQQMQEMELHKQQQENDGNEALELQRQKQSFISKYCKLIESVPLDVYRPKCKETFRDEINRVRKVEIGSKKRGKAEKVVIVVGATGSGKTTLINGMFNYVVGVDWKDDYRFKLIQECIKDQSVNQAKSQTSWITAYTIHHKDGFAVSYTLTIIDTPGFGDTSGIKRDQQITEQIRKFFTTKGSSGIDTVDAVGFVSQSSLPRLTPSQKYIFDSVLSLFGKDIAENIFMLLTFADGQKPQVLSGIKEAKMPFKNYYKFNNSALYVKNTKDEDDADEEDEEEGNFNEMFWKVGVKSFKNFMTELGKVQPRSLVLTKQVLTERGRLELTLEGIQKDLKVGLNKLEQLSKEVEILKRHQADLDKNKNFTYEMNEETIEVEPTEPGQYTTNCMKCNMTCHEYCSIPDDEDKSGCWAMVNDHCNICAESCHWSMHKNQPYIYIIKSKKVSGFCITR